MNKLGTVIYNQCYGQILFWGLAQFKLIATSFKDTHETLGVGIIAGWVVLIPGRYI